MLMTFETLNFELRILRRQTLEHSHDRYDSYAKVVDFDRLQYRTRYLREWQDVPIVMETDDDNRHSP